MDEFWDVIYKIVALIFSMFVLFFFGFAGVREAMEYFKGRGDASLVSVFIFFAMAIGGAWFYFMIMAFAVPQISEKAGDIVNKLTR